MPLATHICGMARALGILTTQPDNPSRSAFIARIALMVIAVAFWLPIPVFLLFAFGFGDSPTDFAGWAAVLLMYTLMFPIALGWRYPVVAICGYIAMVAVAFLFGSVSNHNTALIPSWTVAVVALGVPAVSLGLTAALTVWRWSTHVDAARSTQRRARYRSIFS